MKSNHEFSSLTIALYAPEIISTFLTEKFLKESTVIPKNWEFAEPPEMDAEESRVIFTNGVRISAEDGVLMLSEDIIDNRAAKLMIPKVVEQWVEIWHQFNYVQISIKPNSFYTFKQENNTKPSHYIPTDLLASNEWQKFSQDPPRAALSLSMTSPKGEFSISLDDVMIQQENDKLLKVGVFCKGDFSYPLCDLAGIDRQEALFRYIRSYSEDWNKFYQILRQKFLHLT
jgi:hypothetical protein